MDNFLIGLSIGGAGAIYYFVLWRVEKGRRRDAVGVIEEVRGAGAKICDAFLEKTKGWK